MSRYTSILDGCEFVDSSLAESGYDYYLFTRLGGSGVIQRLNIAGTESRFFVFGSGNVTTIWIDRTNKHYKRPSDINK